MPIIDLVTALVVGVTLGVSGIAKMFDLRNFVNTVASIRFLSFYNVRLLGYCLPFFEVIIGVLLIFGVGNRIPGILAAILFLTFIFVNLKVVKQKIEISCNCFGKVTSDRMGWGGIIHSVMLLLFCIPVIGWFEAPLSTINSFTNLQDTIMVLIAAAVLFFLGMISRKFDFE